MTNVLFSAVLRAVVQLILFSPALLSALSVTSRYDNSRHEFRRSGYGEIIHGEIVSNPCWYKMRRDCQLKQEDYFADINQIIPKYSVYISARVKTTMLLAIQLLHKLICMLEFSNFSRRSGYINTDFIIIIRVSISDQKWIVREGRNDQTDPPPPPPAAALFRAIMFVGRAEAEQDRICGRQRKEIYSMCRARHGFRRIKVSRRIQWREPTDPLLRETRRDPSNRSA